VATPTDREPDAAPTAQPPAAYLMNLTGGRIDVLGEGRSVVLAPLRKLPLSDAQLCAFDPTTLRDSELVRLERPDPPAAPAPVAVFGVLAVLGATALAGALASDAVPDAVGVAAAGAVAVLGLVLWGGWEIAGQINDHPPTVRSLLRWAGEKASQLMIFVIGFGAALAASVVATGVVADERAAVDGQAALRIALQTVFLGLAITFPAFLYYAFDRQRAAALRTRFLLDTFRLDDRLQTAGEVEARYGARMKDAFGDAGSRLPSDERVRAGRRRSPVVVATLVLSLALVVAFADGSAVTAEGPDAGNPDGPLLTLFTPTAEILPFAFLGAYLFAVLTSLRSYLRGDLLPKAYSQIAARMLVVVALAAVLSALSGVLGEEYPEWLLALAFFAGLVPNTVLQFLAESTRRVFPAWGGAALGESQPLTRLQGIDLYDRARLEQEGVTTLGGLVYGDLVDLMIQTRIPAGRLVDWLDQAVLQVHLDDEGEDEQGATTTWRSALRTHGIRSASELVTAPALKPPLESLAALLREEPAMRRVLCWKQNRQPEPRTLDVRASTRLAAEMAASGVPLLPTRPSVQAPVDS
jgi:hypothetical protein